MTRAALPLAILGLLALIGTYLCGWIGYRVFPGVAYPLLVLFETHPLVQPFQIALILLLIVTAIVGLVARGRPGPLLRFAAWGALLLGVVGALISVFETLTVMRMAGTTRFDIVAPSIAEASFVLSLGLLAAALAARLGRPRSPAPEPAAA